MSGELRRPDPVALAQGQAPLYVATRLFDYSGRWFSATAEEALVRGVRRGLAELGLRSSGGLAFLPFRDSNEALDPALAGDVPVTRQVYLLDLAAIARSYAVVALLNDPQKDSGVCFEIGYAASLGRPLMPVVNDFIDYRYDPWGWVYPLDPVLTVLAPAILKVAGIPALGTGDRRRLYRRVQDTAINILKERLALAATELVRAPERFTQPIPRPAPPGPRPRVHLEFGGGLYEWQRLLTERAQELLAGANLPCDVTVADRYTFAERALDEAARADIAAAAGADVLVTLGDGADMDAGSAALQGLARGFGRRVVLYYSGAVRWVAGAGDAEERNLMLQHSADALVHTLADLSDAVRQFLPGGDAGAGA